MVKQQLQKNATVQCFGSSISSRGFGSSKNQVDAGGSGGFDKDKKITPISEIHPMLDSISIQGRCISIWHPHRMNVAHDPYSLDLVLQDVQNRRIQVYIKKEFMFRFQPLFEEGKCYIISNFGIAKNNGRLPLLPRRYKISFYKSTTVTRIDPFDNNTNGFILKPFNHLLDYECHEYHENDVVVQKHDKSATMNKHLNTHESSTNEEGSSSRKRRLMIDLDEVESEPEEQSNNFIDYEFVEVKKERDDI
ncbi:replication protein A 70 kDa DNA-binding subunit B [Tanacetum coccineum]